MFGWKKLIPSPSVDTFPPSIDCAKDGEIELKINDMQDGFIVPVNRELIMKVRNTILLQKTSQTEVNIKAKGKSKLLRKRRH